MFKRIQQQRHQVGDTRILVSYDRLTSRFKISDGNDVIYSRSLLLLPLIRSNIVISNSTHSLKVISFIFWRAKLEQGGNIVISELLRPRRAKSIASISYSAVMSVLRFLGG